MLPEPDLSSIQCLDALEINLKTVLLHTGSALSLSSNFGATSITLTKDRVREKLPPSLDNFHRALGDLELELVRSRSVLHRHLAASREQLVRQHDSSAATQSENGSRALATAQNTDSDTVMAEAPQSAVLSHVLGPPSPLQLNAAVTDTSGIPSSLIQPPADDPLAHSKPSQPGAQAISKKAPNAVSNPQDKSSSAKGETNGAIEEGEAIHLLGSEMDDIGGTSGIVNDPETQRINESAQMSNQIPPPPQAENSETALNLANQDGVAGVSDSELYTNNSYNANTNNKLFNVEALASSNAINTSATSANDESVEDGYNQEFSADLPAEFLQDGTGDGTSFEEQFDFGAFDFGGSGEGDRGDASGESQNWDSNFFDESLFNLDGGTGD